MNEHFEVAATDSLAEIKIEDAGDRIVVWPEDWWNENATVAFKKAFDAVEEPVASIRDLRREFHQNMKIHSALGAGSLAGILILVLILLCVGFIFTKYCRKKVRQVRNIEVVEPPRGAV